jgi:hypothetical protein
MSDLSEVFTQRRWWIADVSCAPSGVVFVVRPGARIQTIWRKSGAPFNETLDRRARLDAHVGDRFVVCGPSVDETIGAAVDAVDGPRLHVTLAGDLAPTTTLVQLLAANGATKKKRRSA